MAIVTQCQQCRTMIQVGAEHAGKKARCPVCGHVQELPREASSGHAPSQSLPTQSLPSQSLPSQAASPQASLSQSGPFESLPLQGAQAPRGLFDAPGPAASEQTPPAGAHWFMKTPEGATYGPVTKSDLDRWVAEGRVSAECQLRCGYKADWHAAGHFYPNIGGARAPAAASQPYASQPYAAYTPPAHNPYAFAPAASQPAHYMAPRPGAHMAPHRGVLVLVLAIVGVFFGCGILSVIAWILGHIDLREMRAGRMDPGGQGMTQAGMIIGMIFTGLQVLSILLMMVFVCLGVLSEM